MSEEYMIKQLSVFINNEPGSLAEVAAALKACDVDIKAFNIAESNHFGVFRAIVTKPNVAFEELSKRDIIVKETNVIAIPMINKPGGLLEVANIIGNANINIEYGYAYASANNVATFFFRVDDTEGAIKKLQESKIKMLRESEI